MGGNHVVFRMTAGLPIKAALASPPSVTTSCLSCHPHKLVIGASQGHPQWRIHLQCSRRKRCGLDPCIGTIPGGGNGDPRQYSCLENPVDRGAWRATVHGVRKSRTQQHTCARDDWAEGPSPRHSLCGFLKKLSTIYDIAMYCSQTWAWLSLKVRKSFSLDSRLSHTQWTEALLRNTELFSSCDLNSHLPEGWIPALYKQDLTAMLPLSFRNQLHWYEYSL